MKEQKYVPTTTRVDESTIKI